MTAAYPRLFAPITVGRHALKNRIAMGSMHSRLELMDQSLQRELAFYEARAKGGASLIITAGYSPTAAGRRADGAHVFNEASQVAEHRAITDAVHAAGAKMLLQILHAGRYAKHDRLVGPSPTRSPINKRVPRELSGDEVEATIEDFVRCAELAREAGYDGVDVMGSEGYLITQFTAARSNQRTDQWGGSLENRCRFAVEIVRRIRQRLGPDFLLAYRISALDLTEDTLTGDEVVYLAKAIEVAGADMISTGIGWHEAPVPTISYQVPRAAWRFAAHRLKQAIGIPVMATNRMNTPEICEDIITSGDADLVALARPMLADPDFANKAAAGRADEITPCIACNQACLDYIFSERSVSCLVNPRAGREIEFLAPAPSRKQRVAVVGAGPAGLACAINASRRGHAVTLFEASGEIGGQLNLARQAPGKTEFNGLLAWFARQLDITGVNVQLNTRASAQGLKAEGFDRVVVAAGIEPRQPDIPGVHHAKVVNYLDILSGRRQAGQRVAIIGTGGIGHDVAEYLLHDAAHPASGGVNEDAREFFAEWGVDIAPASRGGLTKPGPVAAPRQITLYQRSPGRVGDRLGVSTGWILRGQLKRRGVESVAGCGYDRIDDAGLHMTVDGQPRLDPADTIVICAGQEPQQGLAHQLQALGVKVDLIGGARFASELDATRAIDEGTRLAYSF